MKLIFLIILFSFILSQEVRDFNVIGYLTKDQKKTTTSNGMCVYLDTYVVDDYSDIEIFITVNNGNIYEDFIYYGETSEEPILFSPVTLTKALSFSSKKEDTYYFKLPYPNERYFYLSFPIFMGTSAQIGVYTGIPVWAIVLILLAIVALIFIIIIIFVIRHRRLKINNPLPIYIDPPVATITTPVYAAPTPFYSPPTYPKTNLQTYYA